MDVELCAGSYRAALVANKFPFNRVELCSNLEVGGLTPSAGTIVKVLREVKAECHVLIRPRSGDFNYTEDEIEIMKADIEFCRTVGCTGVVFGVLNSNNRFDLEKNLELLEIADNLECTFHRAIDDSLNFEEDLESIINCGFKRVLTSGKEQNVQDGLSFLTHIKSKIGNRIELMLGGGVNAQNVKHIISTLEPSAIHFSGTEHKKSGEKTLFQSTLLEISVDKINSVFQNIY